MYLFGRKETKEGTYSEKGTSNSGKGLVGGPHNYASIQILCSKIDWYVGPIVII